MKIHQRNFGFLQLVGTTFIVSFAICNVSLALPSIASPSNSEVGAKPKTLISIEFKDTAVAEVLNMVSKQGGISLIVGQDVTDRLPNIYLEDVTPDQAIRYIAQAAQLTAKKIDAKTYIIYKSTKPANEIGMSSEIGDSLSIEVASPADNLDESQSFDIVRPTMKDDVQQTKGLSAVELKNVKPSMMAYWLDPKNHRKPLEYVRQDDAEAASRNLNKVRQQSKNDKAPLPYDPAYSTYTKSSPQVGGPGGGGTGGAGGTGGSNQQVTANAGATVSLPDGVDNLIALDSINSLLVRGTDEGVDRLREIIAVLDRPVQQVEIEAQFVNVTVDDRNQFGLSFGSGLNQRLGVVFGGDADDPAVDPEFASGEISYVGNNFAVTLAALKRNGRARIVNAPRVTTFNNMTAQLQDVQVLRFITNTVTDVPGSTPGTGNTRTEQEINEISVGTILTVTPTINRDGTITISLQPIISGVDTNVVSLDELPNTRAQTVSTSLNIKDGDTLAIGGLRTTNTQNIKNEIPILSKIPLLGRLFQQRRTGAIEQELIIFVTARVVRRIDDPVPGT